MSQTPNNNPAGAWFKLTSRTYLQVTDRTAVATAAFDRVVHPVTGDESMRVWPED